MRPVTIGRALGISVRLVGRAAIRTLEGPAQPAGSPAAGNLPAAARPSSSGARATGRMTGQASGGLVKGLGGFLRPFSRVGGTIWLEVTGVFFLLPVIVFTPMIWRTRMSWAHGPDHRTFIAAIIVVAVFFYLGVTSFWRAHRRGAGSGPSRLGR